MINWNDLKYLLHTARQGSTLAASRLLDTSQSTVMRRIAAVEEQLGLTLFDKRRSGYLPTEALRTLLPRLEAIESAHMAFDREAASLLRSLVGTVRLTAPELLVSGFVAPALFELRKLQPGISVDLVTTDRFLDLSVGEADLALRGGDPPTEPTLFGRRIQATEQWSAFCSRSYEEAHGKPESPADLPRHAVISVIEGLYPSMIIDWVHAWIPRDRFNQRHSSLASIHAAVKAGLGISIAPDIVVLSDPDLVRCFQLDIDTGKELWLLAPERHRNSAHVRVTMEFLGSYLTGRIRALLQDAQNSA